MDFNIIYENVSVYCKKELYKIDSEQDMCYSTLKQGLGKLEVGFEEIVQKLKERKKKKRSNYSIKLELMIKIILQYDLFKIMFLSLTSKSEALALDIKKHANGCL